MASKDIIDTERRTAHEQARSFAVSLCVGFTIVMLACMTAGSIFADEASKQGISLCWSVFGVCAASAALQLVFFTPTLIRQMAYPLRLLLFGLCLYAILATTAHAMDWFPSDNPWAWVSFTATYLLALATVTAIFSLSHKRQQRELNDKLAEYHRK